MLEEVAIVVVRKVQLLEVPCRRLAVVGELERSIAATAAANEVLLLLLLLLLRSLNEVLLLLLLLRSLNKVLLPLSAAAALKIDVDACLATRHFFAFFELI